MGKTLILNNEEICIDAQNVNYANASLPGVSNIKGAMDAVVSGAGQGTGADIKMAVVGDSTASDLPYGGAGELEYHCKKSIYKWVAQFLNAKKYTNLAVHGSYISGAYTKSTNVPSDTNAVFIQTGINDITNDTTSAGVGYASAVMELDLADDVNVLKSTLIGYYRLCLAKLREVCGAGCKIYAVSPLYYSPYDNASGSAHDALKQLREEIHNLVDLMNEDEDTENYVHVGGLLLGVDYTNYSTMYADYAHPNDTGAKFIAENLIGYIDGYLLSPAFSASVTSISMSAAVNSTDTETFTVSGLGAFEWKLTKYTGHTSDFTISPSTITTPDGRLETTTITVEFHPTSSGEKSTYIIVNGKVQGGYVALTGTAT